MSKGSELYLGSKNAVLVCINACNDGFFSGEYYHKFDKSGQVFESLDGLVFSLDRFFDQIDYPVNSTKFRRFASGRLLKVSEKKVVEEVNNDNEILGKHGSLGTYIIRVQHRQNSTWQGRITWVEKNETVYFRSIFEMLKIIESGMPAEEDEI